jgi:hypothetical protein
VCFAKDTWRWAKGSTQSGGEVVIGWNVWGCGDAEVGRRFNDRDIAKTGVCDFTLHCLLIMKNRPMSGIYVFEFGDLNRVYVLLLFGIDDRYSAYLPTIFALDMTRLSYIHPYHMNIARLVAVVCL